MLARFVAYKSPPPPACQIVCCGARWWGGGIYVLFTVYKDTYGARFVAYKSPLPQHVKLYVVGGGGGISTFWLHVSPWEYMHY